MREHSLVTVSRMSNGCACAKTSLPGHYAHSGRVWRFDSQSLNTLVAPSPAIRATITEAVTGFLDALRSPSIPAFDDSTVCDKAVKGTADGTSPKPGAEVAILLTKG